MLEKNLESLLKKYPDLKKELDQVYEDSNIEVISAKNGSKTALYKDGKRSVMLHSKYIPEMEARKYIDNIELKGINSIIIFGFGLGYHIKELYNRILKKGVKIFIIVENLYLFKKALSYNDFSDLFNYDNFYLYLICDYKKNKDLVYLIQSNIDIFFEKIKITVLPFIEKIASDELYSLMKELKFFKKSQISNNKTVAKYGKIWEENMVENLELILKNPGVEYISGRFQGKPAIIVSAGPSLNKNVKLLKRAKGKVLIIAVDAVLKRLLKEGIIPDIVAVIDGSPAILKFFEGLDYSKLKDVILLSTIQFFNHILEDWPGPLLFAPTLGSGDDYMYWIEQNSDLKGRLPTGGSVAHLAFMFAWKLQANPIVFIGQDLAFTNGITHVDGCDVQKDLKDAMKNSKRAYFEIKDIDGNQIWTRDDFKLYLDWFNKTIEKMRYVNNKRVFIDATEGGALIEGTKILTLEEVIDKYSRDKINIKGELLNKVLSYKPRLNKEILNKLEKEINNIREINQLAREGIHLTDLLSECESDEIKVIYNKIDKFNKRINDLKSSAIFFESSLYRLYNEDNFGLKKIDLLRNLLEFYNSLIEGSEKAIPILERNLRKLKNEVM